MSNWTRSFGAIVALVIGWSTPAYPQTPFATGQSWTNELGSVLTITSTGNQLSGTYVTNVGCSAGVQQPMTGWYYPGPNNNGGAITFSVYFQNCNSVTSWSGQYNTSNATFQELWYLTAAGMPAWNGINAGTDTFAPSGSMKK